MGLLGYSFFGEITLSFAHPFFAGAFRNFGELNFFTMQLVENLSGASGVNYAEAGLGVLSAFCAFMLGSFLFKKKKKPSIPESGNSDAPDFIIVGQGLAGTLLALELDKRGKRVLVVDDAWKTAASQVAAGVLNPVTGMRIVKTLGVDDLLPAAKRIYAELGERFEATFFHETPFYRFYTSDHERSVKAKREQDPDYAGWISPDVAAGTLCGGALADRLGGFFVQRAGWLDIPKLLEKAREYLRSRNALIEEEFNYADVAVSRSGVVWRGQQIRGGIIFCEGFRVRENPWFRHLKWQPAKGEFVEIELAGTENFQAQILKSAVVAIPLGDSRWRVGTNYDREILDSVPTPETAERLRRSFCGIFSPAASPEDARIVAHRAGVRPAIQGTLPKVGAHETHTRLFLFNGFGSKGVTWIPLYAERFAENLCAK